MDLCIHVHLHLKLKKVPIKLLDTVFQTHRIYLPYTPNFMPAPLSLINALPPPTFQAPKFFLQAEIDKTIWIVLP